MSSSSTPVCKDDCKLGDLEIEAPFGGDVTKLEETTCATVREYGLCFQLDSNAGLCALDIKNMGCLKYVALQGVKLLRSAVRSTSEARMINTLLGDKSILTRILPIGSEGKSISSFRFGDIRNLNSVVLLLLSQDTTLTCFAGSHHRVDVEPFNPGKTFYSEASPDNFKNSHSVSIPFKEGGVALVDSRTFFRLDGYAIGLFFMPQSLVLELDGNDHGPVKIAINKSIVEELLHFMEDSGISIRYTTIDCQDTATSQVDVSF